MHLVLDCLSGLSTESMACTKKIGYVLWISCQKLQHECGKVTQWIKAPEYDPQDPDENQFLEVVL